MGGVRPFLSLTSIQVSRLESNRSKQLQRLSFKENRKYVSTMAQRTLNPTKEIFLFDRPHFFVWFSVGPWVPTERRF